MLEYKDLLETNDNSKLGKGTSTNMKSNVIRFTNKVDSAVDENEVCSWRQEHFDTLISLTFLSLMVEQRTVLLAWLRLEHETMCL